MSVSAPILVCPDAPELLGRLGGFKVVLRVQGAERIPGAVREAAEAGVHLHCLVVQSRAPLSDLPVREDWGAVPLALEVPEVGRVRDFVLRRPALMKLNARVYLPASLPGNYTGARILSSLGIPVTVSFGGGTVDWDLLGDLATYALFGLVRHAPIEPFTFLAERYQPGQRTDFAAVYFDDPARFLHLDAGGRVFITRRDQKLGRELAGDIFDLGAPGENPEYLRRTEAWRETFLEPQGCAWCEGWRICLGKFSATSADGGCRRFFTDLLSSVEQRQSLKAPQKQEPWQP